MPTPRSHGGAALAHTVINAPGLFGVNLQNAGSVLPAQWATKLLNTVLDDSNRITARKGWTRAATEGSGISGGVVQLYEYRTHAGVAALFATDTANKIHRSTDEGITWTDVTGDAVVTDPNMQFVSFHDGLYGWQGGGAAIRYTGLVPGFEVITGEGLPTGGGVALAAFGRVWAVDPNGYDVRYSALLNGSKFDGTSAGVLSLRNVWTGNDTITALAEFNGSLVVFGKRNIVMWADGTGSALGLDPTNAYVRDTVERVGCVARDSVQHISGDLWFLSDSGLTSFARTVSAKSDNTGREPKENPFNNLSQNVHDHLRERVSVTDLSAIRSVYSPKESFYLLSCPATGAGREAGQAYCFDTRGLLEDGSARCVGVWDQNVPRALVNSGNNVIYTYIVEGLTGTEAAVGTYSGYHDGERPYQMTYEGAWSDLAEQDAPPLLKFPKKATVILYLGGNANGTFKMALDYQPTFTSSPIKAGNVTPFASYGEAGWGEAQWAGGGETREIRIPLRKSGEYIKVGIDMTIGGAVVSLQQISLLYKAGRLR